MLSLVLHKLTGCNDGVINLRIGLWVYCLVLWKVDDFAFARFGFLTFVLVFDVQIHVDVCSYSYS